jgi:hypothetical protein
MMTRILGFLVFLIILPLLSWSDSTNALDFLTNPDSIVINNDTAYITDGACIYILSLKPFVLKNVFGKHGEGPQEFLVSPNRVGYRVKIDTGSDFLLVNTMNKVSLFTLSGEFIRETKTTEGNYFKIVANKFVGYKLIEATEKDKAIYISYNIYNQKFQREREIFRKRALWQLGQRFNPIYYGMGNLRGVLFQVYDDRIFIEDVGDKIQVFDSDGKCCGLYELDLEKAPVSSEMKRQILNVIKETRTARIFHLVKSLAEFPDHFPLRDFRVTDNRIFVLSFIRKDQKSKLYVFDLGGKLMKSVFIPFYEINLLHHYPYTIKGKRIYQLVDDDTGDGWLLRIHELGI